MSIEQKKMIAEGAMWIFRIALGIVAWLAVETFQDIKTSIDHVDNRVEKVSNDVMQVRERVIRLETKIEDSNK